MKQVAQSIKDGRIQVLDVPAPTLRPHGVLAQNAWSLISAGTERAKVDLGQKSLLGKARSRPDQVAQVVAEDPPRRAALHLSHGQGPPGRAQPHRLQLRRSGHRRG